MLFRAHVVGSMLRPQELLKAHDACEAGALPTAEFKRLEDEAVSMSIRDQEDAGIELVTDGEIRRQAFGDVMARALGLTLTGKRQIGGAHEAIWHGMTESSGAMEISNPVGGIITERLRRGDSQAIEEFAFARAVARHPIKVTLPSPTMFSAAWSPEQSSKVYRHPGEAMDDIVEILKAEVHSLARIGCTHIQFDAPEVTFAIDAEASPILRASGQSREAHCAMVVQRLNQVAVEPGVEFSVHFCRGNARGHWHSAGGYDAISKLVFPHLSSFRYVLLEYDTDRAGGFDALRDLPDECCAVLGLVTTKSGEMESLSALKGRVAEAARFVPKERLAVSPQCGFASDAGGNPLSRDQQREKLRLVGRLAREIWN
jgi:methionine synthase II (cobalamin-independent)